jgi:hypothetical protein
MIAFSGSVEGRSGSVTSPAPSCFRVVREEEWLVLREPLDERLIGDDPVPVVGDVEEVVRCEAPAAAALAVAALASAWPQTLQ